MSWDSTSFTGGLPRALPGMFIGHSEIVAFGALAQLCFFVWRSYEKGCPQLSFCWKAGVAYSW